MRRSNKLYQHTLHRCFLNGELSQIEFNVLKTLSDVEIEGFFSFSKRNIKLKLLKLKSIFDYYKAQEKSDTYTFCKARCCLGQEVYLWAHTVKVTLTGLDDLCPLTQGLCVLGAYDSRMADVWGLRLKIKWRSETSKITPDSNQRWVMLISKVLE